MQASLRTLETSLATAVQASLELPQSANRCNFIGRHLKAQAEGSSVEPAASSKQSVARPSAEDLSELSTALSKAVNSCRPDMSLLAIAEALLSASSTPDPPSAADPPSAGSATAARYFSFDELLESVDSGAIAPLSGRWLVQHRRSGDRLGRRQDLPSAAFISAAELRRLAVALGDEFGLLFVVLSYKWLGTEHPDPDRFHLNAVADVAQTYLLSNFAVEERAASISRSPLAAAFEAAGLTEAPDFGLFWDFASLHQVVPMASDGF